MNPAIQIIAIAENTHAKPNRRCIIEYSLVYVFELQVQLDVNVWFVQDQLKGDSITEVRLKFIRRLEDAVPVGED